MRGGMTWDIDYMGYCNTVVEYYSNVIHQIDFYEMNAHPRLLIIIMRPSKHDQLTCSKSDGNFRYLQAISVCASTTL